MPDGPPKNMKFYKLYYYKCDPINERYWWIVKKDGKIWKGPGYDCDALGEFWEMSEQELAEEMEEAYESYQMSVLFNNPSVSIYDIPSPGDIIVEVSRLEFLVFMGPFKYC